MTIEFGLTDELVNTQYAPLAALCVHYQEKRMLKPLEVMSIPMKKRDFNATGKLVQVLLSILAGCETVSEVNVRLKPEISLAKVWHWDRFADQSGLSRTLDALTLKHFRLRAQRAGGNARYVDFLGTSQTRWFRGIEWR